MRCPVDLLIVVIQTSIEKKMRWQKMKRKSIFAPKSINNFARAVYGRCNIFSTFHNGENENWKLTCLSLWSCFVIASLRRFWLLESSESFESVCLELAEPKQPIAANGVHQHADEVSGDVSGDSCVPRASPLRARILSNGGKVSSLGRRSPGWVDLGG